MKTKQNLASHLNQTVWNQAIKAELFKKSVKLNCLNETIYTNFETKLNRLIINQSETKPFNPRSKLNHLLNP